MKFNNLIKETVLIGSVILASVGVNAATLKLSDGSSLEGSVQKIHDGTVYLETQFAGVLEIAQDLVTNLESVSPIALRVESGEVFQGPVRSGEIGSLQVESANGTVNTSVDKVVSSWQPGAKDPVVAAEEAALAGQIRKWTYLAGLDVSGSDGNTDTMGTGAMFEAKLEGPSDRLFFYGTYKYQETDGIKSEEELVGGVSYTNFFSKKSGWYVRQELEKDKFENIDFRSTSAGGLTYRFIQEERMTLEGRAGLSYRHESYSTAGLDDGKFTGLDFGADYMWQFADWGKFSMVATYVPSLEDFAEFIATQESRVDVPLGTSDKWVMRFGLGHKYNSEPVASNEKLDTTYFIRLILNWK